MLSSVSGCLEPLIRHSPPRHILAYEQALRGALVAWREKERELATTSPEFEYLHRKSRCEMLLGEDDISGTCFSMFVYICADWWKSDNSVDGESQGKGRWNSNSRDIVASSPSFSYPAARVPQRACPQVRHIQVQLYWHGSCQPEYQVFLGRKGEERSEKGETVTLFSSPSPLSPNP